MRRRWIFPSETNPGAVSKIRSELGVPRFIADMLVRRGFGNPINAEAQLHPRLRSLSAPEDLPEMGAATERILAALRAKERIALYGDYDVDGITSLAILARVLKAYGAEAPCFLPLRA